MTAKLKVKGHGITLDGARNVIMVQPGRNPLISYEADFKGTSYWHLRRVWQNDAGAWLPAKQGISCLMTDKPALLNALKAIS